MIIIGVSMFYFLVSSINTNISKQTKISKTINKKLYTLYNYMKKYDIPIEIIKKVKKVVVSQKDAGTKLEIFPQYFEKVLQTNLEFYLYMPILKEFNIFKYLRRDIIAAIGKSVQKTIYPQRSVKVLL
jgi:hypothetical protein